MAAGLQVFGDSGVAQIDQDYFNYVFKQSGALSFPDAVAGRTVSVSVGGVSPIVVIKSQNLGIAIWRVSQSGSAFTFEFVQDAVSPPGTPFQWYLFDKGPPSPGNFGLQVFGPDGSLSFDSSSFNLKIAQLLPGVASSGNSNNGFFYANVPAGNWGFVMTNPRMRYMGSPSGAGFAQVESCRVTSNAVYIHEVSVGVASQNMTQSVGGDLLLVDLTGL
ncbi:hypothetical protein [Collimonas sp.]|jgi:hypothetical protein|uniref:hypothetical protein n=1 Tax=Collimonas sp. TaxID=1963772 RepID=UPI002B6ED93C|nr:hypothetical protein [Collimonas sp.]HWX01430.1 hypothetical protein [Collimonas sp.]